MVLEDFRLLGRAVRPERETAAAVPRPRSRRRDDFPIVAPNSCEKLSAGFALVEPHLAVGVERRKCLCCDLDRDPTDIKHQVRLAHGNDQSPIDKPPISFGCPRAPAQPEVTDASASSKATVSATHECQAGAVS